MLPGLTGVELCRRLRAMGNQVPVILMTVRDEVSDRVNGLDAGADDYVVKPFSIEELLARVRAHLRRHYEPNSDQVEFEDLRLNRRTREFFWGDRSIELTAKEFDLLEYLVVLEKLKSLIKSGSVADRNNQKIAVKLQFQAERTVNLVDQMKYAELFQGDPSDLVCARSCSHWAFSGSSSNLPKIDRVFHKDDYLLSHPRRVFTREQILEHVWGYDFMGDSNCT